MSDKVLKLTQLLCNALEHDYMNYTIRSHNRSIQNGENVDYHDNILKQIAEGDYDFQHDYVIETGKKYHKVVMSTHGQRSVHCFVDKVTGDVYKSASWKAPTKGVRYALLDDNSREQCYRTCDWAGGYLYA